MGTFATLIELVRRELGQRDAVNKLSGAYTSGGTSIVYTYTNPAVAAQKRISVDVEDFHVWDVPSAKTLTVAGAQGGSTAANHSDGSTIRVDPEFSPFEIASAVNEEIYELPSIGIPRYRTVDLTGDASKVGYNLTSVADLVKVHRVSYKEAGSTLNYRPVRRDRWRVMQQAPTGDFAAAEALFIHDFVQPGNTIRVLYHAPWTQLNVTTAGLAEDVETISSVPARIHPILAMGAALRLTDSRPSKRSSTSAQGDTRRPDEVSTGDTVSGGNRLERRYQQAIQRERGYLLKQYGA